MCLAVPCKVVEVKDDIATVDIMGARCEISLILMPEKIKIGDFVLVHAGFAIQKVEKEMALRSIELFKDILS